ncbi:hypothetical protein ACIRS1_20390 [Kitasatospora sp. NPDC101176]|uniref:hypothetical protein n=1 Tax=Kitasatospora sp. NPDC101176 TaxID=3364099 RepID=UPI0037FDD31F
MTDRQPTGTARALDWAASLYPDSYGRERAREVAETAALAAEEAGPWGRLRQVADVAAHGLRVGAGLSSDRPLGRALGLVAPWAATLAGVQALLATLATARRSALWPGEEPFAPPTLPLVLVTLALLAPVALTAGAALLGRWAGARAFALAALASAAALGAAASATSLHDLTGLQPGSLPGRSTLLATSLAMLLVRICPPDRAPGRRAPLVVLALGTALPGAASWAYGLTFGDGYTTPTDPFWLVAPMLAAVVLAVEPLSTSERLCAAVPLLAIPVLSSPYDTRNPLLTAVYLLGPALLAYLAAAAARTAVRRFRAPVARG